VQETGKERKEGEEPLTKTHKYPLGMAQDPNAPLLSGAPQKVPEAPKKAVKETGKERKEGEEPLTRTHKYPNGFV
jgi:hypothetical protein